MSNINKIEEISKNVIGAKIIEMKILQLNTNFTDNNNNDNGLILKLKTRKCNKDYTFIIKAPKQVVYENDFYPTLLNNNDSFDLLNLYTQDNDLESKDNEIIYSDNYESDEESDVDTESDNESDENESDENESDENESDSDINNNNNFISKIQNDDITDSDDNYDSDSDDDSVTDDSDDDTVNDDDID
jgi:hypothetical protein